MKEQSVLRVGIVGAGHFGRFHALKAHHHAEEHLVGIYDPNSQRASSVAKETRTTFFHTYHDLLHVVDAIIIASPAETHFILALEALKAGKHVLVEKPIAATLEEGEILTALSHKMQRVLQVGHLLRYSAEHHAITQRIKHPLYIEATRIAPFKARGTDVSVVLDLMIHDLDLILSVVESPIVSIDAMGAAVSSHHEDIANARVRFENGCVATITASRVSLKTERRMRIFAQEGYLSANFMEKELTFINKENGFPLPGTGGYRREAQHWQAHDNLTEEHNAFVNSCLRNSPVIVSGEAGLRALDAALKVTQSIHHSTEMLRLSGLVS